MQKDRIPLIVANWKMHGSNAWIANWMAEWQECELSRLNFIDSLASVETVLCPPATHITLLERALKKVPARFKIGAQNVNNEPSGPFTGEISANMLKDTGCDYVIIGHSERRQSFYESDELIARKFVAAYDVGLVPIFCVGETQTQRQSGQTFEVVKGQLKAVLRLSEFNNFPNVVIAYEPVWAIGTGITATPAEAGAVHRFIRGWMAKETSEVLAANLRILYGGSVKPQNAKSLFAESDIDGALVGGASLDPKEFFSICESAIESVKWNKLS
jgi:triosephosphate isomerase